MYRLIAILILVAVVYMVLKRALFPVPGRAAGSEEDLVRDPVCGCYIPRGQSLTLSSNGRQLFFCSQECFRKYQASSSLPKD
jgi:YHS domain-containing protein